MAGALYTYDGQHFAHSVASTLIWVQFAPSHLFCWSCSVWKRFAPFCVFHSWCFVDILSTSNEHVLRHGSYITPPWSLCRNANVDHGRRCVSLPLLPEFQFLQETHCNGSMKTKAVTAITPIMYKSLGPRREQQYAWEANQVLAWNDQSGAP
jgi:hypothetical protein